MNSLWKGEGYDLCMSPYNCVTTGDELGMLEVVTNSMTLAGIIGDNQASTGTSRRKLGAVMDALGNDKIFRNWLEENNSNGKLGGKEVEENPKPTHTEGEEEKEAQGRTAVSPEGEKLVGFGLAKEKFLQSCAGYTVATFVLGIGDRHNDNIMLKRTGEIFHIDFGHFLGNFKKKLGFKREKAPFVFTPAFAAVLDGFKSPTFHRFEDLCCECLLILRKHAGLLITLFSLMISCGIPELTHEDDINYLKERLMLDLKEDQVKKEFKKIITTSMKTKTTRVNDAIHVYVHT
jgi:phosphatidylinositol kinase/protein kinase (PI-3  family)